MDEMNGRQWCEAWPAYRAAVEAVEPGASEHAALEIRDGLRLVGYLHPRLGVAVTVS